MLAVVAGVGLAALDVVSVDSRLGHGRHAIELALILTLFSDGLLVERELLGRHWGPPARALIIAMPVTMALIALCARVLFPQLDWAECFLLGAVLSPTDPVVTSTVVTARRVPGVDPPHAQPGVRPERRARAAAGALLPGARAPGRRRRAAGARAARRGGGRGRDRRRARVRRPGARCTGCPGGGIAHNYEGVYALGLALFAYGLADVTFGNGLIAAFVAGVALAVAEHDVPEAFGHFNENVSAVFQAITFFLFGALIVDTALGPRAPSRCVRVHRLRAAGGAAGGRPARAGGHPASAAHKLFIAWFGPKGVASMLFALLVLNSAVPHNELVFETASFVILASIVAHGLTDTVGSRWLERRSRPGPRAEVVDDGLSASSA